MTNKTPAEVRAEKLRRRKIRQARKQQQAKAAARAARKQKSQPRPSSPPPPLVPPTQEPAPYNYTAYVVAGGPSLKGFNWSLLDDKFTVGVNRAYEVLPNAEIIYFTDEDYYKRHIDDMLKHKGRLIKGCINPCSKYHERVERFHLVGTKGLEMTPGKLVHGRNSTYAVINMLAQWKFKTIYLLGVDMKWGQKGKKNTSHWHDGHKRIDGEGTYKGFIETFKEAVPHLQKHNIEIINVNNDTNLKAFPIKTYEEVFGPDCFIS